MRVAAAEMGAKGLKHKGRNRSGVAVFGEVGVGGLLTLCHHVA